ncbi:MAG: biotin/lipoate A/B protein ligase family protein [Anaerosomatales bacterium]|nr:biotin/lipoate A/B protein ligase family protein [Anaerosomatales bacterium]
MTAWRLIVDGPVDGARTMAIDRAVLRARADGAAPATVRVYRWRIPTVTLGRFQDEASVDLGACRRRGFDVVRRPTGGRGVLHDDELTYSIVASTRDGLPRGTAASYRHLCAALAETYRSLGVDAALTERSRGERSSAACYLHATNADLSLGAAKLSGSAQVWEREACLQHGSFVRTRDVTAEADVFRLDADAAGRLAATTATLADALGAAPAVEAIAEALAGAVERVFGVTLEAGDLTDAERAVADTLEPEHRVLHVDGNQP